MRLSSLTRIRIPRSVALRRASAGLVRCASSSSNPAFNPPLTEGEWKRWNSLDVKDERERMEFAAFVAQLQAKFELHDQAELHEEAEESGPADGGIFLQRPHRSPITFPESIKLDCIQNLLQVAPPRVCLATQVWPGRICRRGRRCLSSACTTS